MTMTLNRTWSKKVEKEKPADQLVFRNMYEILEHSINNTGPCMQNSIWYQFILLVLRQAEHQKIQNFEHSKKQKLVVVKKDQVEANREKLLS